MTNYAIWHLPTGIPVLYSEIKVQRQLPIFLPIISIQLLVQYVYMNTHIIRKQSKQQTDASNTVLDLDMRPRNFDIIQRHKGSSFENVTGITCADKYLYENKTCSMMYIVYSRVGIYTICLQLNVIQSCNKLALDVVKYLILKFM